MHPFVLIANCDQVVGEALHEYLHEKGYETSVAADAENALSQLRLHREQRSLVLLDVRTPKRDLLLLARMGKEPELATIPAIVMMSFRRWRVWPSAVRGLLRKPFDLDVLLRTVRGCVGEPIV